MAEKEIERKKAYARAHRSIKKRSDGGAGGARAALKYPRGARAPLARNTRRGSRAAAKRVECARRACSRV